MSTIRKKAMLREEQDVLDRLENVKRLIEMETTLKTVEGAYQWCSYQSTDGEGVHHGSRLDDLIHELRGEIQIQLLSIAAICYGNVPDIGEPAPMLEWNSNADFCAEDRFRDTWEECLHWNA